MLGQLVWGTVLALCISASSVAEAEIYRWVDENGRVHYSDRKREDQPQEVVDLRTTPSEWQPYQIQITTIGFELSEEELADISLGVNNVYRFYDQVMYFDFYKTLPVSVKLFDNEKAYRDFLRKLQGREPPRTRGVYLHDSNQILAFRRKNMAGTLATLRHETSHAIIGNNMSRLPRWINEGLAEQMETIGSDDHHLFIGPNAENSHVLRNAKNLPSLEHIFSIGNGRWHDEAFTSGSVHYSYGGELVRYLLSNSNGRQFISRSVHAYKRGENRASIALVNDNWIGGLAAMGSGWMTWMNSEASRENVNVLEY